MTYEELKHSGFAISMHYSNRELAILGQIRDGLGGDEPIVTISKVEPFNYHPRDYRDTALDIFDWLEAVKLAQKLALTPLSERGKVINHDWIKMAHKALKGILGRG